MKNKPFSGIYDGSREKIEANTLITSLEIAAVTTDVIRLFTSKASNDLKHFTVSKQKFGSGPEYSRN